MGFDSMKKEKLVCFLPCRKGSERVPRKNIKPFSMFKNGLIEIKLKQLCDCVEIDEILLSSNDEDILGFAESLGLKKITLHKRSENLSSSSTSTDDLMEHVLNVSEGEHILWTHVTSPFVNSVIYSDIIKSYFDSLSQGYDSLMTVSKVQGFLWDDKKPLNYNRADEKWPRTQTLKPIYEVNSAAFVASRTIYEKNKDRIGDNVYLYELSGMDGHDIDWEDDFLLGECMLEKGLVRV